MIELKNVTKEFKGGVTAVDNISINFERGRFYGIMGPSGSGKSTVLNLIGALDETTSGEILINGTNISKMSENEKAELRMKNIGYVFQGFYLNKYLNAVDNVIMPMRINPAIDRKIMRVRAEDLLEKVGLGHRKKHYPKQMSGGEQQRVAIARALANCIDDDGKTDFIILADEPTGNLDEANEKVIFSMLKDFVNEGKTVITVSHNELVREYADEIICLNKGKIVYE